ncbi:NIPSNAP family protein [Hydrogenophaga sp. YM1]|uniref:NIPSNAP family protein n=1 Tax=Hydrogenophaga sp. YM1 TaxID=2806262 RepID=UPI00195CD62F|nr:NIPSNAP family protein [Hydrogenophaga sp. YM1]QRR33641.1 NIPSNAP family protein [Hydrogenophaga sp. YM1]
MLIEERCYVLHAEYTPAMYLDLYRQTGALDLQMKTLGNLLGYFVTEVGELNALVHLWGYDSFEERARRRALLAAEPVWQDYLVKIRPMLQSMNNRLLTPTGFSPIR